MKPLYNPAEAAEIVRHLTDGIFDPEYILLFGSLAGGTPHSDAMAYDLLIVVRDVPDYDWMRIKRYLRYKMPFRRREIACINPYINVSSMNSNGCFFSSLSGDFESIEPTLRRICTDIISIIPLNLPFQRETSKEVVRPTNSSNSRYFMKLGDVIPCTTPFVYFAHKEEGLYCKDHYRFRRPKNPCDFAAAYCDARYHYDTFSTLGNQFLERACSELAEIRNRRMAALFTAQAAVYFYHILYFVFHGREFDSHDPVIMHERMRTLSAELMLAFDDSHIEKIFTLPSLKRFLLKGYYHPGFSVALPELDRHLERVEHMGGIIQRLCERRLELYKESGAR